MRSGDTAANRERTQRRLAAILVADVVGYSRLMGADEAGTLASLKSRRSEIVDPLVAEHGGRVFKLMGDAILVEFASAVNALECAIGIQKRMAAANAALPESRHLRLRIGLNVGDVLVEGDDLYGDGINIAARLQELAEPGGICVSGKLRDEIGRKLDVNFQDLGERALKNIAALVRAYRVHSGQTASAPASPDLPLPDKPSIVVLPFVNLGGDPEQEYFADGITEDLIAAIARFKWFFVIGRNTSFAYKGAAVDLKKVASELGVRYVLEGSLRRSAQALRVTAQLIDAATSKQLWAGRFDRGLADIFAIQDEITESVAGSIEPEILKTESGRVAARSHEDMTGWDLVRQGMWYFHKITREGHYKARALFRAAIKIDPQLSEAHSWLARVNAGIVPYGWTEMPEADLAEGRRAALEAIHLDETNPYSHYGLAITSIFTVELDQAKRAAQRAIELSPSFALGHLVLGMARLFLGDAAGAVSSLQHGLRLSPYDAQNFVWLNMLALAQLFSGQSQQAVEAATKALQVRPDWQPSLATAAICLAAAGRRDEARQCAAQMKRVPAQADNVFAPLRTRNPVWAERMQALLREAESEG